MRLNHILFLPVTNCVSHLKGQAHGVFCWGKLYRLCGHSTDDPNSVSITFPILSHIGQISFLKNTFPILDVSHGLKLFSYMSS